MTKTMLRVALLVASMLLVGGATAPVAADDQPVPDDLPIPDPKVDRYFAAPIGYQCVQVPGPPVICN